jgi:flavin reductase (DIM6/NTAB) family NADH-FMN oxidoreductase RutF
MKKSLGAKPLVFPCPVFVVGTYDAEGKPNIMTAAWGGICCSQPPCVSISLRKATYTFGNLMARKAFTISIPSESQVSLADYAGLYSGRDRDKFEILGLTPTRSRLVDAPYVEEFGWNLECEVIHTLKIGLHTLFVGKILDVKVDEQILDDRSMPDIGLLKPAIYAAGVRSYFACGRYLGDGFKLGKDLGK